MEDVDTHHKDGRVWGHILLILKEDVEVRGRWAGVGRKGVQVCMGNNRKEEKLMI